MTCLAAAPASVAHAQASSSSPAKAEPATSSGGTGPGPATGGSAAGEAPKVGTVTCRSACAGLDAVQAGSGVRLTGEALEAVSGVVFLGAEGAGDDVVAPVAAAAPGGVDAAVPSGAATGPVAVVTAAGVASKPSSRPLRVAVTPGGGFEARVDASRVFFGARRAATLDYFVPPGGDRQVVIDLVRGTDGRVLAHHDQGVVAGGSVQSVSWNGVADKRVQKDGRYVWRVTSTPPPGTATAAQAEPTIEQPFTFLRHTFPLRGGGWRFGPGGARYGAGRGYGAHQGQDVLATCGTPLVAARGGVVKHKAFHGRAGNYLVIDGRGEGYDHVYMHLRDAALVEEGQTVYTGQLLGYVGDTGSADGCNLHFEVWKAPGWYSGGSPIDPLPVLQSWAVAQGGTAARQARASARAAR